MLYHACLKLCSSAKMSEELFNSPHSTPPLYEKKRLENIQNIEGFRKDFKSFSEVRKDFSPKKKSTENAEKTLFQKLQDKQKQLKQILSTLKPKSQGSKSIQK